MQDEGLAPKNRTIASLREKPVKHPNGGQVMVTYDPGITQKEADKLQNLEAEQNQKYAFQQAESERKAKELQEKLSLRDKNLYKDLIDQLHADPDHRYGFIRNEDLPELVRHWKLPGTNRKPLLEHPDDKLIPYEFALELITLLTPAPILGLNGFVGI